MLLSKSHPPLSPFVFVLGGPVPLVGVTITMDDEALNGTNRVVLDGVLSQSECDTVTQLANVSRGSCITNNCAFPAVLLTASITVFLHQCC